MNKLVQVLGFGIMMASMPFLHSQNCLDFDGKDDYVDCGGDTSLQIGGKNITLEAWIYPTAWKTNVYDGNIINKENNTSNYGYMLRCGAGGKLNFAFGDGSWHELTSATTVLSLNTWQHVAGTYDGSKMRIYLNGIAVDSISVAATIYKSTTPNLILGNNITYSRYYQGQMDEVKVWDITRSQSEIANGMYNEICASTKGLKGYYKFNHGKAGKANFFVKTLSDYSGYKNHGTLINFTLNGSASNWLSGQSFYKSISNGNDTIAVCGSFTSPSRKYTWNKSGIYHDTIASVRDCDSAITFYLTIKKSGTSTLKVHACSSYVSPSGNYTWVQSGVYVDHMVNYQGCDSAITVNLSIGGGRDTLYPVTCMPYTLPSGKRTYTVSGIYTDTFVDYRGCDSIITIYLIRNNATYSTLSPNVCRSYTLPSGKRSYTQSGVYQDTLVNQKGCDSFVRIELTVMKSSGSQTVSNCYAFTSPSGKYIWTQSGVYKDTVVNYRFCDSVITTNLTILNSSSSSRTVAVCFPYTSPSGKYSYKVSGKYTDTIQNVAGCDSVISIDLTVTNINNGVTQNAEVLTAQEAGANYKWLNCTTSYSVIPGATGMTFTATKNGKYAVEISVLNCKDTSACYDVNTISLTELLKTIGLKMIPNPNRGQFQIQLSEALENVEMTVLDLSGRVVYTRKVDTLLQENIQFDASAGMYVLRIKSAEGLLYLNFSVE